MPLAAAWLGLHRPVRALETVLEGLALDPEDADLVRVKTQILSQFASKSSGGLSREKDVYDGWSSQGPFAEVTVMSAIIRADHLQAIGKFGAALSWCLRAVNLSPHDSSNLLRASNLLYRLGRVEESRRILFRAVRLDKCASTCHQIGQISQELLDFPAARKAYEEALVLDPEYVPSLCALGHLFQDMGNLEDAEPLIQKALRIKPDPLVRLVLETALPPLYKSIAEMHERRQTLVSNFERMISEGVLIDPKDHVVPTIFYVPYQGLNDREIASMMGRICSSASAPSRSIPSVATSRRIRIGFLSKFFCQHTIGRLNIGTIRNLSRERFEVVVASAQRPNDSFAEQFVKAADEYVVLNGKPRSASEQLQALDLDVLFFTDVGMDPMTYSLAFTRSAPIQCVTWGHPVTTGSRFMDYFISSELLEVSDAQDHYTEKLVKLPDLAVFYTPPKLTQPLPNRKDFGFTGDQNLYGCLQTLFKFHPEFDEIIAGILLHDRNGHLLLIEGRHDSWTQFLRDRLSHRLGANMDRVHFLPRLAWHEFIAVTKFVDVLLDPLHFGGGNTTYEALAVGTPVVSWPGQYLRSRITYALYEKMNFLDLLVDSVSGYVDKAVQLGKDRDFRKTVSEQILARSHVLFNDTKGIRQLEDFLEAAVQKSIAQS